MDTSGRWLDAVISIPLRDAPGIEELGPHSQLVTDPAGDETPVSY